MKRNHTRMLSAFFFITLFAMPLLSGCGPGRKTGGPSARISPDETIRICVTPFFKGRGPAEANRTVDGIWTCRMDELCSDDTDLEGPADAILTRLTNAYLKPRAGNRVIPPAEVIAVYEGLTPDSQVETPQSIAVRIGREVSAEWVLIGTVWRYRERIGVALGVDRPASVAFAATLIETETGRRLWQGVFDETQRSLSENLLKAPVFFRRGATWLTAEDLARAGIEETFRSFPF